jgi:hypothetical protein
MYFHSIKMCYVFIQTCLIIEVTGIVKTQVYEPRHDKTNIVGLRPASTQSDQDPCCSLTNSFTSRETDSEQHGS